jgi:hypothetical protein
LVGSDRAEGVPLETATDEVVGVESTSEAIPPVSEEDGGSRAEDVAEDPDEGLESIVVVGGGVATESAKTESAEGATVRDLTLRVEGDLAAFIKMGLRELAFAAGTGAVGDSARRSDIAH